MTQYLVSLLLVVAAAFVVLFLWGYSILRAYHSLRRQTLPRSEKIYWLAMVIVFPLAGYAVYRAGRLIGRTILPPIEPLASIPVRGRTQRISLGNPAPAAAAAPFSPAPAAAARPDGKPRWRLVVAGGPCVGEEYYVSGLPVLIGRGPNAGISLEMDLSISRQHAELYQQRGDLYIRDLDSQHGITVNGDPVMAQKLQPGDLIGAGASLLVLYEMKER